VNEEPLGSFRREDYAVDPNDAVLTK